ncbi:hypothetical protein [Nocardia sp. NBC_00511]|uniref:hypothetical protein n=1 Tax=Nocardia sp. NBC_00511 TaxID=2903591 RepID=UPI0030DF9230
MTIFYSDWQMTSDLTPEAAQRVAGWEVEWKVSWLPERRVSRGQALAGMELAEIFSGNHRQQDAILAVRAHVSAQELGVSLEEARARVLGRRAR